MRLLKQETWARTGSEKGTLSVVLQRATAASEPSGKLHETHEIHKIL